ncbi:thioesterase [Clostridium sp. SYSU_GA19001]|uniref:acyl-[acyl-carrier-protein] thioesterase n=1 Tax=Clostridium caldaquaticum TaxID=2940653 RepID=UPI0020776F51|nr:acyl-ACP thioesterase domain-containing protein [Clostridium caldaquaticum]MCM8711562.1 thioesterase [Clostridium caldaquaticum]
MSGFIYEKEYEIHYYEVDYKRKVLITSIVDFLGDIATKQSEELGVGIDFLKERKLSWVLYKWNIDMYKYPSYGEKIIIKTYAYSMRKFYAYRKYEILSSDGEILGGADSIWFLINTERRRPVRVTEDLFRFYGVDINDESILEIEDLERCKNITSEKIFNVRYSDIDTNRHVNNAKYIAWMLETVPLDIVLNYTLKNIKVTYEKETTYGETIKVLTELINEDYKVTCLHKIIDKEDKELTLLKTVWEKN